MDGNIKIAGNSAVALIGVLLCLSNTARGADGDPGAKLTIVGTVTESGSQRGLTEVEVQLESYAATSVSSASASRIIEKTLSRDDGSFRFTVAEAARYRVTIHKAGYSGGNASDFTLPTSATVLLDEANPYRSLRFELTRPAQLLGVIVDGDTREPVAGLLVRADGYSYRRGHVALSMRGQTVTDERGRFHLKDLPPGNYVISSGARIYTDAALTRNETLKKVGSARFLTRFTDDDSKQTDENYDTTYWPGGGGLDAAFPITITSGSNLDVGTLVIKSVTMYRARVDIPDGQCAPGSVINLHLRRLSNPWLGTSLGRAHCGGGGIVRGLTADTYRLEATGGGTTGSIEFTVARENVRVSVPLQRGVRLDGVVSLRGTAPIDLSNMRLVLKPRTWAVQHPPIPVAADGQFLIEGVATRDYDLIVTGMPPDHCLRAVRYNGQPTRGNHFTVDPFALDHKLELVVDDEAASVFGAVTNGNDRAFRPWVAVSPWPPSDDLFSSATVVAADDDGQFRITGLVPGEYRAIAVPVESIAELHRPGVLATMLRSAQRLDLAGRETRAIQVKLITPRRF